jgi:D-glycero-D-manno-heptose 1,7-bisphosphate phosphatase
MAFRLAVSRRKALFFDRDGVINVLLDDGSISGRSPYAIQELEVVSVAREAVTRSLQMGFLPLVITNQPGLARGHIHEDELESIHDQLMREVPGIEAFYVCPHAGSGCVCRKPKPGLLIWAAKQHGVDLSESWIIGDRWIDIGAGRAAGCRTVLVERPYSWLSNSDGAAPDLLDPDIVAQDVLDAVVKIAMYDKK